MVLSSWLKWLQEYNPVVHLMNVDWAPGGRQPPDQANRLGLWVRRKLAAIIHIHHRHCYYYSAHKLILILQRVGGWVDLGTAVKVRSPCPRLYIAAAVAINTTTCSEMRTWVPAVGRANWLLRPESWYSIYRPMEGGRLSRPRHCSRCEER